MQVNYVFLDIYMVSTMLICYISLRYEKVGFINCVF